VLTFKSASDDYWRGATNFLRPEVAGKSVKQFHVSWFRRLTLLAAISLLLFFSVSTPGVHAQNQDLIERFEQLAALIRDNKVKEAETELTAILKSSPDLPVALNLMGTIRAKQGRLNEAESLFLRAVRSDGKFVGVRMNLAYLYVLQRAPEKAILQLKEVVLLEPNNSEAMEKLAELLLSQRRFDDCISVIEKQRQSRTLPASLLVVLGDAYLSKGAQKEAEDVYLLALEGRLENAAALLGLAQISQLKGETREASIYLSRVSTFTVDSKSPEFLYKFALVALRVGMIDEAKSALERSLKLRPNDPTYVLALGIAWLRRGDLFEAEKLFRRMIELQPNSVQGQLHLGYVLLNQKKYREAREWLEKSARTTSPIPEVFYYLGLVAQEQNEDARAIELFEKAVQKLPSYAHARIALGSSYLKLKNYERAKQELETAVKLDPDEPTAHYNLALLYARLKDPQRAQEEMRIIERLKAKGAASGSGGVVVLPPTSPNR
jgi:protein O-GlcNAc transferase